jgi:hypothetical protein
MSNKKKKLFVKQIVISSLNERRKKMNRGISVKKKVGASTVPLAIILLPTCQGQQGPQGAVATGQRRARQGPTLSPAGARQRDGEHDGEQTQGGQDHQLVLY